MLHMPAQPQDRGFLHFFRLHANDKDDATRAFEESEGADKLGLTEEGTREIVRLRQLHPSSTCRCPFQTAPPTRHVWTSCGAEEAECLKGSWIHMLQPPFEVKELNELCGEPGGSIQPSFASTVIRQVRAVHALHRNDILHPHLSMPVGTGHK